jgi:hypothetical protein
VAAQHLKSKTQPSTGHEAAGCSKRGAKSPSQLDLLLATPAMSAANQQISRLRADLKRAKTGKATLYNNLGVLLRENGRPAEALRAHRRELTLGRQQNSMLGMRFSFFKLLLGEVSYV